MRDMAHCLDQRTLEVSRGPLRITHQIKAVRNRMPIEILAIERSLGLTEPAVGHPLQV